MTFENRILKKAEATSNVFSFNDICKILGLDFIKSTACAIDDSIKSNAKEILVHYSQCSDILLFIQSAISRSCYDLKYSLHPPYTTSKLDCEYVMKKLINAGLIDDFYYSSLSNSYRIIINSSSNYNLKQILCIGLSSLLEETPASDILLDSCFKSKDGKFIYADVACRFHNKILIFCFQISTGLEKDVTSHSEQLQKLINKVLQSYFIESSNIHVFFIVTPHCKEILSSYNRVVSVDDIIKIIDEFKA